MDELNNNPATVAGCNTVSDEEILHLITETNIQSNRNKEETVSSVVNISEAPVLCDVLEQHDSITESEISSVLADILNRDHIVNTKIQLGNDKHQIGSQFEHPSIHDDEIKEILTDISDNGNESCFNPLLEETVISQLPSGYQYDIKFAKPLQSNAFSSLNFEAEAIVNIHNAKEVNEFISKYQDSTSETLRVRESKPQCSLGRKSRKYIFKKTFRCQHSTRTNKSWDKENRIKNTNCPFALIFKLFALSNTDDNHTGCRLHIRYLHNHQVKALSALSYRDVSNETKQRALQLFKENKTPSSALRILRAELEKKCKDTYKYEVSLADRAMLPRRDDMLYLYRLYNNGVYGGKNGIQTFDCLEKKVDSFNFFFLFVTLLLCWQINTYLLTNLANNSLGGKILYSTVPRKDELSFGVAIVTPLMARVHRLPFIQ